MEEIPVPKEYLKDIEIFIVEMLAECGCYVLADDFDKKRITIAEWPMAPDGDILRDFYIDKGTSNEKKLFSISTGTITPVGLTGNTARITPKYIKH